MHFEDVKLLRAREDPDKHKIKQKTSHSYLQFVCEFKLCHWCWSEVSHFSMAH